MKYRSGPTPTKAQQAARRHRLKRVRQHHGAGLPWASAQRLTARDYRSRLGYVPISDLEPHYLPELGLREPA
ncbi:hypothetical protein GCM10008959_25450 [Deinococcus seoulensis]|uniref:Uncharacterized protein n=1 Tax=Deinococcus seoulensis TaxID=1837379 RepID=A0ABQ2RU52_9DEIO|nr:hypothetical protein [Deinococcus seoulensis]GGR62389.1 hypothetical protein GCM10008959_25450 [Deinococcus seoulensis]